MVRPQMILSIARMASRCSIPVPVSAHLPASRRELPDALFLDSRAAGFASGFTAPEMSTLNVPVIPRFNIW
jgi:hypothetical protein